MRVRMTCLATRAVVLAAVAALALAFVACDEEDWPPEGAGFITVGDDTWTIVPAIECDIAPGPVVSITGHAAEDDSIHIVIDYDPATGFTEVSVASPIDVPSWHTDEATLSVEVEGSTVRGTATFVGLTASMTARGRFEVTC